MNCRIQPFLHILVLNSSFNSSYYLCLAHKGLLLKVVAVLLYVTSYVLALRSISLKNLVSL